ncbi:MAG TPA: DUF3108 domain-containing protein [Bryobacteraceae bacterium]|nr:DUF3108 domain-containing protein [Bryobacteraceae bacterium]
MKYLIALALAAGFFSNLSAAGLTGFPFADEDLAYSINWPSGLGLGETHLHAHQSNGTWNFEMTVDAGIPGFLVRDRYTSAATQSLCSISLQRDTTHGPRRVNDTETVNGTSVTRDRDHLDVPECVKDALTFLYFARRELGQGRVPQAQSILLGGLYPIRLDYAGEQTLKLNGQTAESDKMICTVTTAHTSIVFEAYFARDPARTPLVIRVPFAMGTFSMELVR